MSETTDLIQQVTEELFAKIGIEGTISVAQEEELHVVQVETPDPGILIGFHGKNLEALQVVISQIIFKKTGAWARIVVSVGDYRDRRDKQLKDMAYAAASQVVSNHEPVSLPDLSASERRVVHMALQDHPEVTSYSEGEGKDRHLIIALKSEA